MHYMYKLQGRVRELKRLKAKWISYSTLMIWALLAIVKVLHIFNLCDYACF